MDLTQHVPSLYNSVLRHFVFFAPPPHELRYATSGESSAMKIRSGSFFNGLAHSGVTIRQRAQG